jgi:hypothetical protein
MNMKYSDGIARPFQTWRVGLASRRVEVRGRHVEAPHQVGLAHLERDAAGDVLRNDAVDQAVEQRRLEEVAVVALEHHTLATHPLDEAERAAADRGQVGGVGQRVGALVDVLGQHGRVEHRQQADQRGVGPLQPDDDGGVVGRGDALDHAEGGLEAAVVRRQDALHRVDDVGARHRLAVVEGGRAQREGVGEVVGRDRPRLRQLAVRDAVGVEVEQRAVEAGAHGADRVAGADAGVQVLRVAAEDDDHGAAGGGRSLGQRGRGDERREAREDEDQAGRHGGLLGRATGRAAVVTAQCSGNGGLGPA